MISGLALPQLKFYVCVCVCVCVCGGGGGGVSWSLNPDNYIKVHENPQIVCPSFLSNPKILSKFPAETRNLVGLYFD